MSRLVTNHLSGEELDWITVVVTHHQSKNPATLSLLGRYSSLAFLDL